MEKAVRKMRNGEARMDSVTDFRIEGGIAVTLQEVLKAREDRVARQNEMLRAGNPLISFTLNIPGPVKRYHLSTRAFDIGRREIENQLNRNQIKVKRFLLTDQITGKEGLWSVETDVLALKSLMVAIDEGHPIGRLFDIDVISAEGDKIERKSVGFKERKCLICENPVHMCAGRRVHRTEELVKAAVQMIGQHLVNTYCERVSSAAVQSLLYEVCVTPKPGLVDSENNGAHQDMDKFSFIRSASVLAPYFKQIAQQAYNCRVNGIPPQELLNNLRYAGLMAEESMYLATGGVNTHKGVIYSLGVLCAAYGYACVCDRADLTGETAASGVEIELDSMGLEPLIYLCSQMAFPLSGDTQGQTLTEKMMTNGERAYSEHRIRGVRGEVIAGFPSVRNYGLPALRQKLNAGWSINDACLWALLNLMANLDDTNILARSNVATLMRVQEKVRSIISDGCVLRPEDAIRVCRELDTEFIALNISPGGAADMLSVTLMIYFMEQEKIKID